MEERVRILMEEKSQRGAADNGATKSADDIAAAAS
jgi:hypothetical protein